MFFGPISSFSGISGICFNLRGICRVFKITNRCGDGAQWQSRADFQWIRVTCKRMYIRWCKIGYSMIISKTLIVQKTISYITMYWYAHKHLRTYISRLHVHVFSHPSFVSFKFSSILGMKIRGFVFSLRICFLFGIQISVGSDPTSLGLIFNQRLLVGPFCQLWQATMITPQTGVVNTCLGSNDRSLVVFTCEPWYKITVHLQKKSSKTPRRCFHCVLPNLGEQPTFSNHRRLFVSLLINTVMSTLTSKVEAKNNQKSVEELERPISHLA